MSWAEVKTALNNGNPADSDYQPLNEQIADFKSDMLTAGAIGSVKSVQRGRFKTSSFAVDTTNGAYFNITISSVKLANTMVIVDGVAYSAYESLDDDACLPTNVSGVTSSNHGTDGASKVSNLWGYLQSSTALRIHIPSYVNSTSDIVSMYAKGTYQVIEFY